MEHWRGTRGFTLIEVIVTSLLLGILSALAIAQFAAYRQRAFDARAEQDLQNAAVAEEAYYATENSYAACSPCQDGDVFGLRISEGVVLNLRGDSDSFTGDASHPQGTGVTCYWDTDLGGALGCY